MTIDNKVSDEKLQYDANKEAVKGIIMIMRQTCFANWNCQQVKIAYSLLGKALEKETKTIQDQGERQTKTIEEHT